MISNAEIYTDGSCHTQIKIGAWAAIVLIGEDKQVISGTAIDTTHNAMELTAVIRSIEHVTSQHPGITNIHIITDSQYVIGLTDRYEKLIATGFTSKKGKQLPNTGLVKQLLQHTQSANIQFTKIKAHQKANELTNYNIEVDKLSRKMVREAVNEC
jgi:ribonuclease HI